MDSERLNIRYVKLCFCIEYLEDCCVPLNKVSALREGMEEMLIRANCISDRRCDRCDFEDECVVTRAIYSKVDIIPDFMSYGKGEGYIIECDDYKENFKVGEHMKFQLILFGKEIVYLNQFVNAFYSLSKCGYGMGFAKYSIKSVTNSEDQSIFSGNEVLVKNYKVRMLRDYVNNRIEKVEEEFNGSIQLEFQSPLALRVYGKVLTEFQIKPIINAIMRRIYILNCFEGIKTYPMIKVNMPNEIKKEQLPVKAIHCSQIKQEKQVLHGIEGMICLEDVEKELLLLLLAGELIHIGEYTNFGFGRYRVKS